MRLHCYYFIILSLLLELNSSERCSLVLEVLSRLFRENMSDIARKSEVDKISVIVIIFHVKDRNNDDDVTSISVDMQVHRRSHHLADIHLSGNAFV